MSPGTERADEVRAAALAAKEARRQLALAGMRERRAHR